MPWSESGNSRNRTYVPATSDWRWPRNRVDGTHVGTMGSAVAVEIFVYGDEKPVGYKVSTKKTGRSDAGRRPIPTLDGSSAQPGPMIKESAVRIATEASPVRCRRRFCDRCDDVEMEGLLMCSE